LVRSSDKT